MGRLILPTLFWQGRRKFEQAVLQLQASQFAKFFDHHPPPAISPIAKLREDNLPLLHLILILAIMAPANLPSVFNATSQDIEMLLAAQTHVGSKNLQVHMNPYLWKTRYVGLPLGFFGP